LSALVHVELLEAEHDRGIDRRSDGSAAAVHGSDHDHGVVLVPVLGHDHGCDHVNVTTTSTIT
jgi:hypothetical protein